MTPPSNDQPSPIPPADDHGAEAHGHVDEAVAETTPDPTLNPTERPAGDTSGGSTQPAPPLPDPTPPLPDHPDPTAPLPDHPDIDPSITDEQLVAAAAGASSEGSHFAAPPDPQTAAADPGSFLPPPAAPRPDEQEPPINSTPYRRLYRSRADRRVGGVAAGLAHYLGVDPTLVRIATAVMAITGIGLIAYLVAWIIVPQHPEGEPERVWGTVGEGDRTVAVAVGIASVGLAVSVLSGSWAVLAIVLIGAGLWLLSERPEPQDQPLRQTTTTPVPGARAAAQPTPAETVTAWDPPAPNFVAPAPHRSQRITRLVLSLLALLTAIGLAAWAGDWFDVDATQLLGIGVVIVGAGVVLGAVTDWGARGLIPLGLLGLIMLVPAAAVDGVLDDGVGEVTFRPQTVAELEPTYRHGIGEMTLDLRSLDLAGESHDIDVDLGFGEVTVLIDDATGGVARVEADGGEVSIRLAEPVGDTTLEGISLDSGDVRLPGTDGSLNLDINVRFGVAQLHRG